MPFQMQFVGMVCFFRQNGSRLAMLPDGRAKTPRHRPRVIVDRSSVLSESGWTRTAAQQRRGEFVLPKCTLTVQGADQAGTLVTTDHERHLPKLQQLQPAFKIDPATARTVATMLIQQGTLTAFRYPGSRDQPHISLISQLDVPHDDEITVTVNPTDGSPARTIVLKPGTEIAVVNDSDGVGRGQDHFHIYNQLDSSNPRSAGVGNAPPPTPPNIPASPSGHVVFRRLVDGNDSCPNTGCCP